MSTVDKLKEQYLEELAGLTANNNVSPIEFVFEKLAEVSIALEKEKAKVSQFEAILERSELLFTASEINLLTKNKLPRVLIKANESFPIGDNFYEPEAIGNSEFIRWTGPQRLNNFSVPVDRTVNRTLKLEIVSFVKKEMLASSKLYVDGELVSYDLETRGGGCEVIANLEPSSRLQDTQVSIFLPQVYSPSEVNENATDDRKLGFAFKQLEVQ